MLHARQVADKGLGAKVSRRVEKKKEKKTENKKQNNTYKQIKYSRARTRVLKYVFEPCSLPPRLRCVWWEPAIC